MPLRDHFRPPLGVQRNWEEVHGGWPMKIVESLNEVLPEGFFAGPRVHLGSAFEIDVRTFEDLARASSAADYPGENGAATAWSPAEPVVLLETDVPIPSEYEVLVYDETLERRLVAAIEIVSPGNKDRQENRQAFVHKCETLLHQDVCVVIVDLVTIRTANLYKELAASIGAPEPSAVRTPIYAVACRGFRSGTRWQVKTWEHELSIGQPLPTLPLWISSEMYVPLELEPTYERTCRALRIR